MKSAPLGDPTPALPPVAGSFDDSAETLAAMSTDFGAAVKAAPALVLHPTTSDDVVTAVHLARERGWKLAARGSAHSVGGQALVQGGLVLSMSSLSRVHQWDPEGGWVDVDAGIAWKDLVEAALAHGLAPPVLTDWMRLRVGGTLSLGGVGAESFRLGLQTDHVLELEVVTGAGERLVCSPTQNPLLFNAVRAGLGQFGIVTRARIELAPAPREVTLHLPIYTDIHACLRDLERLVHDPRTSGLRLHAIPKNPVFLRRLIDEERLESREGRTALDRAGDWVLRLEVTRYHPRYAAEDPGYGQPFLDELGGVPALSRTNRMSFLDFVSRIPPILQREKRLGALPHPEVALLLPSGEAPAFIDHILTHTPPTEVSGAIFLSPIARRHVRTPAFPSPDSELFYAFAVLRTALLPTREHIDRLDRANAVIAEAGRRIGGRRYPCDSLIGLACAADWQQHHGPAWDWLSEAKRRYDPEHLFSPGLHMFD